MLRVLALIVFIAGSITGCASIPDIEYTYYLTKMNAVATVVQTVSCASDLQSVVVANTASFIPSYSADLGLGPEKIRISAIEGPFGSLSDNDVSFHFTDDGRLQSINETATGHGEEVIKSLVSLGTTVASIARKRHYESLLAKKKTPSKACALVEKHAYNPKPNSPVSVSLSYSAKLNFPSWHDLGRKNIPMSPTNKALYKEINRVHPLPKFSLWIGKAHDSGSRIIKGPDASAGGDYVNLTLQKVDTVEVEIKKGNKAIWKGIVPIPTRDTYNLPIPVGALFGSQKLALTLSKAGAITQIDYGKNSGAAGAANAAGSIATALAPETAAQRLKAQADVIAQQQRLNQCQASPTTCK